MAWTIPRLIGVGILLSLLFLLPSYPTQALTFEGEISRIGNLDKQFIGYTSSSLTTAVYLYDWLSATTRSYTEADGWLLTDINEVNMSIHGESAEYTFWNPNSQLASQFYYDWYYGPYHSSLFTFFTSEAGLFHYLALDAGCSVTGLGTADITLTIRPMAEPQASNPSYWLVLSFNESSYLQLNNVNTLWNLTGWNTVSEAWKGIFIEINIACRWDTTVSFSLKRIIAYSSTTEAPIAPPLFASPAWECSLLVLAFISFAVWQKRKRVSCH